MATNFQEFPGNVKISSNLEVGTASLFVDTLTGSVGIGTTEPDDSDNAVIGSRLHIKHDENTATGMLIENTNTGNEARPHIQFNNGANNAYIQFNGTGRSVPNSFELLNTSGTFVASAGGVMKVDAASRLQEQVNSVTRADITTNVTYLRGTEDDYWQMQNNLFIGDVSPGGDSRGRMEISTGGGWNMARPDHSRRGMMSTGFSSGQPQWAYLIGSSSWVTRYHQADNNRFYYLFQGSNVGYLENDGTGQLNFTGQHRTFLKDIPTCKADAYQGLIASSNNNKYIRMDKCVETGSNAITINETLPVVSLSNVAYDRTCFGVISTTEDPNRRVDSYGTFHSVFDKELGDTRVYINSVGEGAMWVVNTNGDIQSGDYITTSNIAGYGMKQDDDRIHNYTVAKATMNCNFNPQTQPKYKIKKSMQTVKKYMKEIKRDVPYEDYSNLLPERQLTETVAEYVHTTIPTDIIDENSFNNLSPNNQSVYSRRETIKYFECFDEEQKNTPAALLEQEEDIKIKYVEEMTNVLDENGEFQWEDTGETEKAYQIRYLDALDNQTDEANSTSIAAFIGCTYHCG
jgi:hypothetical protein